jgi:2-polyprenyl-3-methyl-5-hydroxy-6-metoxy-1,4-benzoquinol methylase
MTMSEDPNRWEGVYRSKEEAETSWFEDRPQVSLDLIAETGTGKDAAIVDVGAGSSRLVDCLLDQGFRRITVLDLSETALRTARAAIAGCTGRVGGGERPALAALRPL